MEQRTLADARAFLADNAAAGCVCPCCDRPYKVRRRRIGAAMVAVLIEIIRLTEFRHGRDWVHVQDAVIPSLLRRGVKVAGGDYAKLRYWHLIEGRADNQTSGLPIAGSGGLYRATASGVLFARGSLTVHRFADVLDGRVERLHGPRVTVHDCLRDGFNYAELVGDSSTLRRLESEPLQAGLF
jgi:hypothetical protein